MTEPSGGSDLQALRPRAEREGDEYLVTGSETVITNGYLAELVVLAVKTDPARGARGISLLVCEVGWLDSAPCRRLAPHQGEVVSAAGRPRARAWRAPCETGRTAPHRACESPE